MKPLAARAARACRLKGIGEADEAAAVAPGSSETLRVTDAGLAVLAQSLRRNRASFDAHQGLVERVALEMQRLGRISCTLRLQVHVDDAWTIACPDVYSVRHTTVDDNRARPYYEHRLAA